MKEVKPSVEKQNQVSVLDIPLDLPIFKDCFIALAMSVLTEPLTCSDSKRLFFYGMLSNLEQMGYTEQQVNAVRIALNKAVPQFMTVNSFMG